MKGSAVAPSRAEQVVFEELAELCASPGYAEAIAAFCLRDNLIAVGTEGMTGAALAKMASPDRLSRTEISTLIGLMLRQSIDYDVPDTAVLNRYIFRTEVLLKELHASLGVAWISDLTANAIEDPSFNPFRSAAALREPIFYGGESAYHFQYRDLSVPKYRADNAWLKKYHGFSIEAARNVVRAVEIVQRDKTSALLDAKMAGKNVSSLSAYVFDLADVVVKAGLDEAVVEAVLSAFTVFPGERNSMFVTLSDFNIANAQPCLRREGGQLLLFQIYSLTEALYDSPFFWMLPDKAYRSVASANRGAFTENFAGERLSRVFGSQRVFLNVVIPGAKGETRGEIDALVIFGDRAIVLQAKAKRLTVEARKGNDKQLQEYFKAAIQDASDQAFSCSKLLLEADVLLLNSLGKPIFLREPVRSIFPICLVSDHYPALAFQARQFLSYEVIDKVAPPFVIDVFTLDAVIEMLTSPLRVLSYLKLRAQAGDKFMASGELTLLGYHLSRNLWLGDDIDMMLLDDSMASNLDAAMTVRREGMPGPSTPEGILTRLEGTTAAHFIKSIDSDPNAAVIALGLFLLELDEDTVRTFSDAMDQLPAAARRDKRPHNASFQVGETGITLHVNTLPDAEAMEQLKSHCHSRKYAQKAARWFGMSLNAETGEPRFGVLLEEPWEHDPEMDEAVANLAQGQAFKGRMPRLLARKPKRNELCPCGSGIKYNKCCLH